MISFKRSVLVQEMPMSVGRQSDYLSDYVRLSDDGRQFFVLMNTFESAVTVI